MSSKWHEKKAKKAEFEAMKEEEAARDSINPELNLALDTRDAAMGKGEAELFEKKLSKEEKKALAKAKREAKKGLKHSASGTSLDTNDADDDEQTATTLPTSISQLSLTGAGSKQQVQSGPLTVQQRRDLALEELSKQNIGVVYESKKGALHANTRDINVSGVSVTFHGKPILEDTDLIINYGNRYGFIGPR
jgi:ATP-binding cassette, subfamily F, member 2